VAEQDREPTVVPDDDSRSWSPGTTVNDAIEGSRANGWDDLSPTTVRGYENSWKVHIKDSIGQRQIATLVAYEVERYYRGLQGGRPGGGQRPPDTRNSAPVMSPGPEVERWDAQSDCRHRAAGLDTR
jgi:hypothetical protein